MKNFYGLQFLINVSKITYDSHIDFGIFTLFINYLIRIFAIVNGEN